MEAQEGPFGSQPVRLEGPPRVVADHERHPVALQQLIDRRAEPALVAELEAVPAGRQEGQYLGEPLVVAVEALWELPQDRAELGRADERLDRLVEAPEAVAHVAQPTDVGQVAAGFDGEQEALRGRLDPPPHRLRRGQAVEGRVDLDRVEPLGVAGQPAWLAEALGVELPPPGVVVPAGAADPDGPGHRAATRK